MGHRVDDIEKIFRNLGFLKMTLSQYLIISRSIFVSRGRMRTLWALYEHLQVTPRPIRSKLGDITASRDLFRVIFVPRVPCDNSEVSVRARSFVTTHLVETVFWHRMTQKTLENGWIQCRRWKTSPRTPESVKNWPLWTERCPWPDEVISYLAILDFKIFVSGE